MAKEFPKSSLPPSFPNQKTKKKSVRWQDKAEIDDPPEPERYSEGEY